MQSYSEYVRNLHNSVFGTKTPGLSECPTPELRIRSRVMEKRLARGRSRRPRCIPVEDSNGRY